VDRRNLNRITAAVLTLAILVVALMLSGSLKRPSRIVLPQEEENSSEMPGVSDSSGDALTMITITPQTVQAAIETLARPEIYRRTVSVQQFWNGGNGTVETTVASLAPWLRIDRTLADGRLRHTLTDGEATYIWLSDSDTVFKAAAGEISADMEQLIPTYEDVLELPTDSIITADYRTISDVTNCIYVETAVDEFGYSQHYWVSVESGLLVAAERLQENKTVYRMWETAIDLTPVFEEEFTLPDGTILITNET